MGYQHKAKNHPHIEPVFVNVNGRGEKSLGDDVPGGGIVPL
ncbi:MAG: hypothetical protein QNJ72_22785 [Pleurocapsa sp. MO_226.B13]|nr:hypothetical protein [Pleurocapsa sp. MO_226.B13]